ncbi:MAG: serine/threonine protein kinase [Planctomycetes bacterium]|nr:serine/threonine protein kinase [Planctomycetota bacterium]
MSTLPERLQDGTVPISKPPAWAAGGDDPVPQQFGEFEIVSKLGEGAFGQVFLARQASLDRNVALKVMRGEVGGSEGQLLAGLEHDHIVKVFSAFADPDSGVRGLCLQYVPGADLGVIIRRVFAGGRAPESGRALLDALDAVRRGEPAFDPAALRDREGLAADDYAQAVCRLGGRLAEALAFAHARGVLHCDIKPGNILLTPYGRPMLADFNVAFDRTRHAPGGQLYGGTLAYMAPEYRTAVTGKPGGAADERCDIYSLGVVLHEMATGARPQVITAAQTAETLLPDAPTLVGRPDEPAVHGGISLEQLAGVPRELVAVIRRCLDPDPARRYQTAGELVTALAGAWHLLAARRSLPRPSRVGRWVSARAALALVSAGVLPHVVASVAQIGYNTVEVELVGPQQQAFKFLVVAYNLLVYPIGLGIGVVLIRRLARGLARLGELSGAEVDALRGRARRFAWQVAALGAFGWLPGGLIFPLGIDLLAGPLRWQGYAHFAVSFTLAGVIGVVFSYLAVQYVVFRAVLPRLGNPDAHAPARTAAEVRAMTAAFGPLVVLACGVPLLGAVLLLTLEDRALTLGFRLLVVMLIGLGVAGVGLAERVVRRLRELAAVWLAEGKERAS